MLNYSKHKLIMAELIKKGNKFVVIKDNGDIVVIPVSDLFDLFLSVSKKNYDEFKSHYMSLRSIVPPNIIKEMFYEYVNDILNLKEVLFYHNLAKVLKRYLKKRAKELEKESIDERWVEYFEDEDVFYIHKKDLFSVYINFYSYYKRKYKGILRWYKFLKIVEYKFSVHKGGFYLKVKTYKSKVRLCKKILKTFDKFFKKAKNEEKKAKASEPQTT